ncbi:MAG: amino acid ABC transporter substrate-binding protein [Nitrososphaerota archaeon]|nr:amino acid ABC transporter substrate-binding protein [Nitrososphaerota archaeon]
MKSKKTAISTVATVIIIVVIIAVAGLAAAFYFTSGSSGKTTTSTLPPLKIGMAMPLTGALSGNGAAALLAIQIWANDTNKAGGLLGRQVQIVYYDDASTASNEPAIYQKLITVDHVDFLFAPYGGPGTVTAIPIAEQYHKLVIGTFALDGNPTSYGMYFSMFPAGTNSFVGMSEPFFSMAASLSPKPQTVAITGIQNAFGSPCAAGASENAVSYGFKVVYNQTYPASTTDFTAILTSIKSLNPDIVYACSYPTDSVSFIQTMKTINFTPSICCGGMVGLQYASDLTQLGPMLNGLVNFETWAPASTINFPGMSNFLAEYQPAATAHHVDPLGYYVPPFAYAGGQVLAAAIEATQSTNDTVLSNYLHSHSISTIVGTLTFGANGEWTQPRMFYVQFQGINGTALSEFTDATHWVVVAPTSYKSGTIQYPFPGWQ